MSDNTGKGSFPWGIIHPGVVAVMLDNIVKEAEILLGLPGEVIFKEGLKRFLTSKAEENENIIRDLKKKYGIGGYLELEKKIKRGEVSEHPAWEDVILWEELSNHALKLRDLISRLEAGGVVAS
ncbi:MAG: hypothetical protein ACOY4I_07680 [Bacillota bacterium]